MASGRARARPSQRGELFHHTIHKRSAPDAAFADWDASTLVPDDGTRPTRIRAVGGSEVPKAGCSLWCTGKRGATGVGAGDEVGDDVRGAGRGDVRLRILLQRPPGELCRIAGVAARAPLAGGDEGQANRGEGEGSVAGTARELHASRGAQQPVGPVVTLGWMSGGAPEILCSPRRTDVVEQRFFDPRAWQLPAPARCDAASGGEVHIPLASDRRSHRASVIGYQPGGPARTVWVGTAEPGHGGFIF